MNTPSWVERAPEGHACDKCQGTINVMALRTIFNVPRRLCFACLGEAVLLAHNILEEKR